MRWCSYNVGLIVLVIFGNFAKLDSRRRLVQFWQNFQGSLALLIPNCTHNRMITSTYREAIPFIFCFQANTFLFNFPIKLY